MNDLQNQLMRPLDPSCVKTRRKGKTTLSYVEGWHVIDEANKVFGFGGWSRETAYCREVSREEVGVGDPPRPGFKVGYEAKVIIKAAGVVREGTGLGSGISTDLFDAIEGAAKEAETDAMKRALMTFGYRFGLALYDKEQRHVHAHQPTNEERLSPDGEHWDARFAYAWLREKIRGGASLADFSVILNALPPEGRAALSELSAPQENGGVENA